MHQELLILNESRIIPYYQPQFNANKKLISSEILLRFRGKDTEAAITEMEATEQIDKVDIYAASVAIQWIQIFGLQCASNFSGLTLSRPGIVEKIEKLFSGKEHLKSQIKIEITEGRKLLSTAKNNIKALSALGYYISLDDYGSKYNSLSRILELPVSEIKIDRLITSNILLNQKAVDIVESILFLADRLGLGVIVEGVECPQQFELLKNLGCNCFQGYLFSKPRKFDV